MKMKTDSTVRIGGVLSTAGVALFIAFVAVLVIFPVVKACDESGGNCTYSSTAPEPFKSMVQPAYLAISLLVIAGGVLMVRLGRWRDSRDETKPVR